MMLSRAVAPCMAECGLQGEWGWLPLPGEWGAAES